jgi:hypothetical protein
MLVGSFDYPTSTALPQLGLESFFMDIPGFILPDRNTLLVARVFRTGEKPEFVEYLHHFILLT